MQITIECSVRHFSTSSDYMWHQLKLIKCTYYSTTMEYYYSTAALDQTESWNIDLDALRYTWFPLSRITWKYSKALKKMESLKENGILIF